MSRVAIIVLLAGCRQIFGIGDPALLGGTDGNTGDGIVIDAPTELCKTFRSHHFDACMIPAPIGDLHLTAAGSPYSLETLTAILTDGSNTTPIPVATTNLAQGGTPALVLSVASLTIDAGAKLRLVGPRPVIVASWDAMTIAGTVDATSYAELEGGAGANPAPCAATAATAGTDSTQGSGGSGGGGGGGFQGLGGAGGPGDTGGINPGGVGGSKTGTPLIVRGGCSGASSGKAGPGAMPPSDVNTIAPGGRGGGAFQLTARTRIDLTGAGLFAGGGGGAGSPLGASDGGGGGGAGGFVGLEAPIVNIMGTTAIAANGGGGGTGNAYATVGNPGADASTSIATGGAATSCANAGANGSFGVTLDGSSASQIAVACGGAGGGGGAGFVLVFQTGLSTDPSATLSPPLQIVP